MRAVLAGWKSRAMSNSARKLAASPRSGTAARRSSRRAALPAALPPRAAHRRPRRHRPDASGRCCCGWYRPGSSGTLGSEWPKLMVRRLRPAPNTRTQSASAIIRRAAECENDPTMPRLQGWPRNRSLPRAEVTSSAPIRSASCSSAAFAPARCAPRPATISGLRLCRTRATAASIACGRGAAGAGGDRFGAAAVALAARSISASCTLTGSSNAAAPPCNAAAAASAKAPRAVAGLVATKVRMPAAPSTPVALKPL